MEVVQPFSGSGLNWIVVRAALEVQVQFAHGGAEVPFIQQQKIGFFQDSASAAKVSSSNNPELHS